MGKKLRNQVIALAVAASMTVPEAAALSAEAVKPLAEVQDNVDIQAEGDMPESEQNQFEEEIQNESDEEFEIQSEEIHHNSDFVENGFDESLAEDDLFSETQEYDNSEDIIPFISALDLAGDTADPFAVSSADAEIKLTGNIDYLADKTDKAMCTFDINLSSDAAAVKPDTSKFKLSPVKESSTTAISVAKEDVSEATQGKLTFNVAFERDIATSDWYLMYDDKPISASDNSKKNVIIRYTRNLCALADVAEGTPGTSIDARGVLTYSGKTKNIVINNKYGSKTISGVRVDSATTETVVVPNSVKNISSSAFPATLKTLVLPDSVTNVEDGAIGSDTKVYFNGDDSVLKGNKYANTASALTPVNVDLDSSKVTIGSASETSLINLVTPLPTDADSIKWVLESADGKPSKNARFADGNDTGKSVNIENTKANGQFNNQIILKAVNKSDSSIVYAMTSLYITPEKTTGLINQSGKNISDTSASVTLGGVQYTVEKKLSISVGETAKLTTKAADGANKNLCYGAYYNTSDTYDTTFFTVENGTVKGVAPGKGYITVQSESDPSVVTAVEVEVTGISVLSANVKALTLVNEEERIFSLNGVADGAVVQFETDYNTYDILYSGTSIPADGKVTIANGVKSFTVKVKAGKTAIKSGKITVTTPSDAKNKVSVTLISATTYQNVSKINESVKKSAGGLVAVSIPVGGEYNPGLSVSPAAASDEDAKLIYELSAEKDKWGDSLVKVDAEKATVDTNGTVKGLKPGVYYLKAHTAGKAVDGNPLESNIYEITAYEAGGSIEWKDTDYVIQGGYLMSKNDADTTCSKKVTGGKVVHVLLPETAGIGSEEIIWTSSNPGALSVLSTKHTFDGTEKPALELGLICAGTYTVTGETKYTKQKFSFKVNIAEKVTDKFIDTNAKVEILQDGEWKNSVSDFKVGEKTVVRLLSDMCGSKITYVSSDKASVSVDSKGNVKFLKENDDTVTVTATMTRRTAGNKTNTISASLEIQPKPKESAEKVPEVKLNIPSCIQNSSDGSMIIVAAAGKLPAVKGITYKLYDKDGTFIKNITNELKVSALSVDQILDKYTLKAEYTDNQGNTAVVAKQEFVVYEVLANKISVHPEDMPTIKRLGTTGKGLASVSDTDPNAVGESIIIDLMAETIVTEKDPVTGKLVKRALCATDDEVEWTSSNTFLATIETIKHDDVMNSHSGDGICTNDNPYSRAIKITANSKGYKGQVVFTGTFKNSGKKVSFKINII